MNNEERVAVIKARARKIRVREKRIFTAFSCAVVCCLALTACLIAFLPRGTGDVVYANHYDGSVFENVALNNTAVLGSELKQGTDKNTVYHVVMRIDNVEKAYADIFEADFDGDLLADLRIQEENLRQTVADSLTDIDQKDDNNDLHRLQRRIYDIVEQCNQSALEREILWLQRLGAKNVKRYLDFGTWLVCDITGEAIDKLYSGKCGYVVTLALATTGEHISLEEAYGKYAEGRLVYTHMAVSFLPQVDKTDFTLNTSGLQYNGNGQMMDFYAQPTNCLELTEENYYGLDEISILFSDYGGEDSTGWFNSAIASDSCYIFDTDIGQIRLFLTDNKAYLAFMNVADSGKATTIRVIEYTRVN